MCDNLTCLDLLHCRGESYCIPPWEVCDGILHCPQWEDDELFCDVCPTGCQCQGNVVYCHSLSDELRDLHLPSICQRKHLKALVYTSFIVTPSYRTCPNHLVLYLVLQHAGLQSLMLHNESILQNMTYLRLVDFSYNYISNIQSSHFEHAMLINVINLQFNQIKMITLSTFACLQFLHTVKLSNNKIHFISPDAFKKLPPICRLLHAKSHHIGRQ